MSAETKAALDDAIAAHFADIHEGAILSAYVLQATGESMDDLDNDEWSAVRATADNQSFIITMGLLRYATLTLEEAIYERDADD